MRGGLLVLRRPSQSWLGFQVRVCGERVSLPSAHGLCFFCMSAVAPCETRRQAPGGLSGPTLPILVLASTLAAASGGSASGRQELHSSRCLGAGREELSTVMQAEPPAAQSFANLRAASWPQERCSRFFVQSVRFSGILHGAARS